MVGNRVCVAGVSCLSGVSNWNEASRGVLAVSIKYFREPGLALLAEVSS